MNIYTEIEKLMDRANNRDEFIYFMLYCVKKLKEGREVAEIWDSYKSIHESIHEIKKAV